jgi:hypothetical protein
MSIENEYRLHYDELGSIIMCSMQNHPDSDRYVVVDQKIYESYFKYRIVKGVPELIVYDQGNTRKLFKSHEGFPVVKNHAALLLEEEETFEPMEYYDYRNR